MEIDINRHNSGPEFARVTKLLKEKCGIPIGTASKNSILDTRMCEVEYADGYNIAMVANTITNNLLAQVNQDGQRFILFDEMINHRNFGKEIKEEDTFIHMVNGTKSRTRNNRTLSSLLNTPSRIRSQRSLYPLGGPNMC